MKLIGKQVTHKKFGKGKIMTQNDTYISVSFIGESEAKKFIYPSCFQSFLKLEAAEAAIGIDKKLKEFQKEEQESKDKKILENEMQRFTQTMRVDMNKDSRSVDLKLFSSVVEFCEEYQKALGSEISFLRKNGGKRQRIFNGKRIEWKNNRFIYIFEADIELYYPDGTQISIFQGETTIQGNIVGSEEFTIIIQSGKDLGLDVLMLEFSAETWRLINSLSERLEIMKNRPSNIVRELVCDGLKSIDYVNNKIVTGQNSAVKMATSQPITFVWGPPGTGKTETLAKIAIEHLNIGNRILMLSYSNVSVDGAIIRVLSLLKTVKPGKIVRYGYPRQKELLEHEFLSSYNLALNKHPELKEERMRLSSERKKMSNKSQRYIEIGEKLADIRGKLLEEEKKCVNEAKFVATTVSKAVVDSVLYNGDFDVVIFDEASMAYIPQIVFSSSLAKKHFVCMGDFRQLPPIVQNSQTSILNVDIFEYCKISAAVDKNKNHKWLCMLDVQYRMHPEISSFSSKNMYNELLRSHESMHGKRQGIVNSSPIPGSAMGFVDLSGMMSVCIKTMDESRVNVLSAFVAIKLALQVATDHEVGIITPYYAQSRLLHAMARDIVENNNKLKPISCATVHQFQGSEKDTVIYDAVDCYRMPYPGMLLTSSNNNYANRLFNVAVTRAKGKFIGVSNISYMETKNISSSLMFSKFFKSKKLTPYCVEGTKVLSERIVSSNTVMQFFIKEDGDNSFVTDIREARREIRLDIPDMPSDTPFLLKLEKELELAKKRGVSVFVRVESKKNLPAALRRFAIQNTFVVNPICLVDMKIVWFGQPLSSANFKTDGRMIQTKYRPMIRFVGSNTAKLIYSLLEMSRIADQSTEIEIDSDGKPILHNFSEFVLANKRCKCCGNPMKLKIGKNKKFFLGCTGYPSCSETALVDVELVERYFYRNDRSGQKCVKCNYSLEAKLGPYGLYIQCCGMEKHKYKLNEI